MGLAGRLSRFFLDSQLTPLLGLAALLLGLFAVAVTPREEEPQIAVTLADIFIAFPGASAADVESLVAIPAEQVLSQIVGLEHVYSVSRPGMAIVTVQFKVGEDPTRALVRLYDTLHSHSDWLPRELGVAEPLVKPKDIDHVPVVSVALWASDPEAEALDLERVAHAVEAELKRVPGTREVSTLGGPQRTVRVIMDAQRMAAYGITPLDLRDALRSANVARASGSVVADNREIAVQTGEFLASAEDVRRVVAGVAGQRPVFVGDVAEVADGADQPRRYVWLGTGPARQAKGIGVVGEFPAVTLAVTKKPGENAVEIARRLVLRLEQLRGSVIPDGVQATVTRNYGETADDKASRLIHKLIFATLSVIALAWAALGRREAAIVGAAVLLTLAATLFASWAWGFTLNRVSLFALIFSIGILVDDAIVVVENIHRRRAQQNIPLAQLIPAAVDEVGGPTILATLTVVAALLPMAFVTGLMGPYMRPIPINASLGMLISLAVAFIVTPWLALRLLAKPAAGHGTEPAAGSLERFFRRVFGLFLAGPRATRNRWGLMAAMLALVAASLALPAVQWVVLKMLPLDNKSEFQVVVDMPAGTPLEKTAQALRELGAYLATVPEVTDYQAYAGAASPINFNGLIRQYYLRAAPERGDIQVNLLDKRQRDRQSHAIAAAVRQPLEQIGAVHGAKVKIVEVPPGPPVLSPIVAEIYGPDYAAQTQAAGAVKTVFANTPGIVGVDSSIEDSAGKYAVRARRSLAALKGVATADMAETLGIGLAGENVTPLHTGTAKYEIPVRLTLAAEAQGDLEQALRLRVRGRGEAHPIPLAELVEVASVERERAIYHKDLLPVVYVVGDAAGGADSPLYGMFDIRSRLAGLSLDEMGGVSQWFTRQPEDRYAGLALKWDGEWQITYETFRDMGLAYAVGLVLIYLLVVAQFRSYLTPLVIMAPIPLTLVGVMPGHALLGAQFTATSMIGMMALAGIIVRNSILLVDFIDAEIADGAPLQEAVIRAAVARAKPIMLTGLAAMLGAIFILDDPIFNGLAVSLLFGILVSTALTLVVIPVLYAMTRRGWESPGPVVGSGG